MEAQLNEPENTMTRITIKDLERACDRLNELTGMATDPWHVVFDNNGVRIGMEANIGNYHISQAYGGYCLVRMNNAHGGVTMPLCSGHIKARELDNKLRALIVGIELGRTT